MEKETFRDFYNQNLRNILDEIEEERSTQHGSIEAYLKKWRKIAAIAGLSVGLPVAILIDVSFFERIQAFGLCFIIIGLIVYIIGVQRNYSRKSKGLGKLAAPFKEKIVKPLIENFNSSFSYAPGKRISDDEIENSQLFQQKTSYIGGDDLIEGEIGGISFRMSELCLAHKQKRSNSSGSWSTYNVPFFEGLFVVVDLPVETKGDTVIQPNWEVLDKQASFKAKMDAKKQRSENKRENQWFPFQAKTKDKLEEVTIKEEPFNQLFYVYSSDHDETKEIIANGLGRQLEVLRKLGSEPNVIKQVNTNHKTNYEQRAVYLSIVNNVLYLAKPYNRPFFNPNLAHPVNNPAVAKQFYKDLVMVEQVIKGLSKTLIKVHK